MTERQTVTQTRAQQIIAAVAPLGICPMMWGPPGIGKSALIKDLANTSSYTTPKNDVIAGLTQFLNTAPQGQTPASSGYLEADDQAMIRDVLFQYGRTVKGRPLYDIRLVQMSPIDLKGIPVFDVKHSEATWVMTGAFPTSPQDMQKLEHEFTLLVTDLAQKTQQTAEDIRNDRRRLADVARKLIRAVNDQYAVVFLDELSVAPAMVQAAALQLVLDRQTGMYHIPKNAWIVAAGNRLEDKVGAATLTPTMASRVIHLHLDANFKDWEHNFAIPQQVHGLVLGYLNFQKQDFHQYKPENMGRGGPGAPMTFACPRTWDMLSRVMKECPVFLEKDNDGSLLTLASGTIGEAQAYSFVAFIRIYHKLPNPEKVFTGEITEINYLDHAPSVDTNGTSIPESVRQQHALGLMYAFVTALNSRIVEIYRESVKNNDPKSFERAFKNYLNFILDPIYIEKTPEIAVISVTSLNEIPRKVRSAIDPRSDKMISRINLGGAYAQRAVQAANR